MRGWMLITGASGGIGRAMAIEAARRQKNIILVARSEERLKALKAFIEENYPTEVRIFVQDLSQKDADLNTMKWLEASSLEVTYLINNAGFGFLGRTLDSSPEHYENMMMLNMVNLTKLTHRMAQKMVLKHEGAIMNISSTGAFQCRPYLNVYAATKAYVLSFSEGLAEELCGTGVTVTTLCPGPTITGFSETAGVKDVANFNRVATDPATVAKIGLDAMEKGRTVVVVGWANNVLITLERFLPRALVRKLGAIVLKKGLK